MNFFLDLKLFVVKCLELLKEKSINVEQFDIDHVCYRVENEFEYLEMKLYLLSYGKIFEESIIGGRLITIFELNAAFNIGNREIRLIELPTVKPNHYYKTGFEHCEFVCGLDFNLLHFTTLHDSFTWDLSGLRKENNPDVRLQLQSNPLMNVKFHHNSLDKVIEMERMKKIECGDDESTVEHPC